jgi:hypothetical protein
MLPRPWESNAVSESRIYIWKVLSSETSGAEHYVGEKCYMGSLLARRWVMNAFPSGATAGSWIKVGEDTWSMLVDEHGVEVTYIVERWTRPPTEMPAT